MDIRIALSAPLVGCRSDIYSLLRDFSEHLGEACCRLVKVHLNLMSNFLDGIGIIDMLGAAETRESRLSLRL